jgi:copper transport protein
MRTLRTAARRMSALAALGVLFVLLLASPAAAHADLVSMTPANGAQLTRPPNKVQMTFTESVNLIQGGIRLVNHVGATVPTPDPTVDGRTVTLPMPDDLPEGPYVVTWRVVSADGHPVSGASSFGIGTAAPGSSATTGTAGITSTVASRTTAPWPVVAMRLAGYVAFALFAGVAVFVMLCAPDNSEDPRLQRLARVGLLGGGAAAVAAILVQGPYAAGVSMSHLLDARLLLLTLATPFGAAMLWRLALYGVLAVFAWRLSRVLSQLGSWLVPAGIAGTAVTVAAAGHAAASGWFDLAVDTLHVLTAGLWVGGLIALASLGRSVEPRALQRFSTLAMASVLTLIVTGSLNAVRRLNNVEELWQTRYGLTLAVKLILVAGALAAAAVSRRRLQQTRMPLRSTRFEAALTVLVLAVTAVLTVTAPPQATEQTTQASRSVGSTAANDEVQMSLGDRGNAELAVLPATTTGSHLHLILADTNGRPLTATRVRLKIANPGRDIAPIPVPMSKIDSVWVANYRFPLSGTWKATLTVDGIGPSAVVTSADITIRD